jgi:hypothetical protein
MNLIWMILTWLLALPAHAQSPCELDPSLCHDPGNPTGGGGGGGGGGPTIHTLITRAGTLLSDLIPVIFGIALVVFMWGIVKYIASQGSESGKADGKKIMLWGVVALFVMSSVWGLVSFIRDSLGLKNETTIELPTIQNISP